MWVTYAKPETKVGGKRGVLSPTQSRKMQGTLLYATVKIEKQKSNYHHLRLVGEDHVIALKEKPTLPRFRS